jgi:hypothetical protein
MPEAGEVSWLAERLIECGDELSMEFQDSHGRPLLRDDYFRDIVDLIVSIRIARVAWQTGLAAPGEWFAFGQMLRSGIRNGVTLPTLIEETESWTSGWWKRAAAAKWR